MSRRARKNTRVSVGGAAAAVRFLPPAPCRIPRSPPHSHAWLQRVALPPPIPTLDTESRPFLEWPAPFLWAASTSRLPPSGRGATGRTAARDAPARDAHAVCAVRRVPNIGGKGGASAGGGRDERAKRTRKSVFTHSALSLLRSFPPPRASPALGRPGLDRGRRPHTSASPHHTHTAPRVAPSLSRAWKHPLPAHPAHTTSCRPPRRRRYVCVCMTLALSPGWAPRAQGAGDEALAFASQPNGKAGGCGGGTFFLHSPVAPASLPATVRGTVEAACTWWKQEAGDRAVRPRAQAFVLCESRRESVVPPPTLCRLHLAASTPGLQWHGCCPPVLGVSGGRAGLARARTEGWAIARWRTRNSGVPRSLSTRQRRSHSPSLPLPTVQDRAVQAPGHGGPVVRWCVVCVCVGEKDVSGKSQHAYADVSPPLFSPPPQKKRGKCWRPPSTRSTTTTRPACRSRSCTGE